MISDPVRFNEAIACFDGANAEDPHTETFEGVELPKELLYAKRMTAWLERFAPDASEELRLAARCQHIRRWNIPRNQYPMNRRGYIQWRMALATFHAETAGEILRKVGYAQATIGRIQALLRKEKLKPAAEVQILEDVTCLVFLESYFAEFAEKHEEEKLIRIIRKTWAKMSPNGHKAALALNLWPDLRALVEKALAKR
ncbi:MAG: DUF4202 domain-containing protein [Deltaproteobacteria bacterium]|nr:DUF4202 domain-containing protein [Deltaproteobacteria bacterium]